MGWSGANDIVESVIETLCTGITRMEMNESIAKQLLVTLIKKCQEGDWDTEDETLDLFSHVPWVVDAFRECGVMRQSSSDGLEELILSTLDDHVTPDRYDLSEEDDRRYWAHIIAESVANYTWTIDHE